MFIRSTLRLKKEYSIWHPTIEFDNLLKYEKQEVYGDPDATSFLYEGNEILSYSEEVKLVLSCDFKFEKFPFDSHNCKLIYGDDVLCTNNLKLKSAIIKYGMDQTTKAGDPPIVLKNLPFPFEFQLKSIPAFQKSFDCNYSYTGMNMEITRKSPGLLISGFYFPTGSFALLSLISFMINADVVSQQYFFNVQFMSFCQGVK